MVATQDFDVRAAVRQFPDVPTLRIDERTCGFIVDYPTKNSAVAASTGARHTTVRAEQIKKDKAVVAHMRVMGRAAPDDTPVVAPEVFRRRKILGPNPLSCRPRTRKLSVVGGIKRARSPASAIPSVDPLAKRKKVRRAGAALRLKGINEADT